MNRHSANKRGNSRRGMAVLLVLVVLSISLALAYGVMRVQSAAEQVQSNSIHRGDARQVALTGLSIGLRKMNETTWVGVGQTVSGSLNSTDRYVITYTTGDPDLLLKLDPTGVLTAENVTDALVSASSNSEELLRYPYRVTVSVKGYSRNPGTGTDATHAVRAVVELSPKKMADEPTNWSKVTDLARNFVLYQRDNDTVSVHMPLQIKGNVRLHGPLTLNEEYSGWAGVGTRYLTGLNSLLSGGTDYRPFTGKMFWNQTRQSGTVITWIGDTLGLQRTNLVDEVLGNWLDPTPTLTYQLFPGGAAYKATSIGTDISSSPDIRPLENPLRIMYQAGDVRLGTNTSLRGSLVAGGTNGVHTVGNNVRIEAFDLPRLGGQTTAVRLPSIVANKLRQSADRSSWITGMVSVDDELIVDSGSQNTAVDIAGKVVAKRIRVRERTEWKNANWESLLTTLDPLGLLAPLGLLDPLVPDGAKTNYNAQYQPRIIIRPDADPAAITYHWHTAILRGVPLYQEETAGSGLRWNVISWKDNP